MHLTGRHAVHGSPEEIFDKLQDPEVLRSCIPGCDELVASSEGTYETRLSVGFGLIRGSFTGKVALRDVDPPRSYTLVLHGEGKAGFVNGITRVKLEPLPNPEWTEIQFESELQVGGLLAAVGGRLLPAAARTMSEQFFSSLEKALQRDGG
jgi:hypothetical protein